MRYVAPLSDNTALCERPVASLKGWLIEIMLWFCEVLDAAAPYTRRWPVVAAFLRAAKAQIARDLRFGVHTLGRALILHGIARMNFARPRIRHASFPGQPIRVPIRRLIRVLRGMNSGPLRQRAERLARAIDNLEPLIARTLKHMRAIWRCPRAEAIVATPETNPQRLFSATHALAHADTS